MKMQAFAERGYSIIGFPESRSGDTFQCIARSTGAKVTITVIDDLPKNQLTEVLKRSRKLQLLRHENLVQLLDSWTAGDSLFLVYEANEAMPIKRLIGLKGRLPEKFAWKVMQQMGSALQLLHNNGWVHGSLNSSCVTADRQSQVKLHVPVVGSLDQRSVANATTDCLAAGIILYEMLTSYRPEEDRVAKGEFLPVSHYVAQVDQATHTALKGLLTKPDNKRWGAQDICRHFEQRLNQSNWHRQLDKVRHTASHIIQSLKTQ